MARPAINVVPSNVLCRLCGDPLIKDEDDFVQQLHTTCARRSEAKRLGPVGVVNRWGSHREFTASDKSLIAATGAYMPAAELLALLNARLFADLSEHVRPYTLEQLHDALGPRAAANPSAGWDTLRRILAAAREKGTLAACTPQLVDDFAVLFRLSPAQATTLKDIIGHARRD